MNINEQLIYSSVPNWGEGRFSLCQTIRIIDIIILILKKELCRSSLHATKIKITSLVFWYKIKTKQAKTSRGITFSWLDCYFFWWSFFKKSHNSNYLNLLRIASVRNLGIHILVSRAIFEKYSWHDMISW